MARKKTNIDQHTAGLRSLFSDTGIVWDTPRLRTGIVPLDYILGGGWGYGRLGELYGGHSTSKTYILYMSLIACQRDGGTAVLAESEGAFDPQWFARLGGDPSAVVMIPTDTTQQVFDGMKAVADYAAKNASDRKLVIGWDSIAATSTKHLLETGLEKVDMSKAKVMSQGCELITNAVKRRNICVLATNQVRDKVGSRFPEEITPGGKAWPFHASQRVELRFDGGKSTSRIVDESQKVAKDDDPQIIGRRITAFVEKNKLGPGMRTVDLPFYLYDGRKHPVYGTPTVLGVDTTEALFDFYHRGPFQLRPENPDTPPWEGPRVIQVSSPGRYKLAEALGGNGKTFYRADWPQVLEDNPRLKELPLEAGPGV